MKIALYIFAYTYVFWLIFICAISTKNIWPTLSNLTRALLLPVGLLGVLMDVFFNIFIATPLLLDWPREWLFTQRMDNYEFTTGWRKTFALWLCRTFLNPFQVGGHCTK